MKDERQLESPGGVRNHGVVQRPGTAGATLVGARLLERSQQLAALEACFEEVRDGAGGSLALVRGEAGIGKSALVREFSAALLAARHLPHWELIDYASATKPDVLSGTAQEFAERLGDIRPPELGFPLEELHGPREARGARIAGTQVHSVRVPSFVVSTEIIFGLPDERLSIRHDAGGSPEPYVAGTLLATRRVSRLVGLTRGLDTLLLDGK